jgi:hypothetical protein
MAGLVQARPGHPRLRFVEKESKTWMPGTRPGITITTKALGCASPVRLRAADVRYRRRNPSLKLARSDKIQLYAGLLLGLRFLHFDCDILAQSRENPENTLVRESAKMPPHQLRYIELC